MPLKYSSTSSTLLTLLYWGRGTRGSRDPLAQRRAEQNPSVLWCSAAFIQLSWHME